MNITEYQNNIPAVRDVIDLRETLWINGQLRPFGTIQDSLRIKEDDIIAAAERLKRFAPFIKKSFPETQDEGGLIESPLKKLEKLQKEWNEKTGGDPQGHLYLKMDSHLAIAGSVKARGGIYEILKHTEELAIANHLLEETDNYEKLADFRDFFSQYTIQAGSTGNLGLSIGIISAGIGYHVIIHMSAEAKQWKKDLLRSKGVMVREYEGDYEAAVAAGRKLSDSDSMSYFVDDEHSEDLFLGYAVAAGRLKKQLKEQQITVDKEHPLFVYLPCGVGGAPGGITFGLKHEFGDFVHCFFAEPVQCPCMLLGMATGEGDKVCVQDFGLTGITHADGLAVGRPSPLAGNLMKNMVSGIFTVEDHKLYEYMRMLKNAENIIIEPSACAAFEGYRSINESPEMVRYLKEHNLEKAAERANHIIWATGGKLVPEKIVDMYLQTELK